jgi:hypothetical protein
MRFTPGATGVITEGQTVTGNLLLSSRAAWSFPSVVCRRLRGRNRKPYRTRHQPQLRPRIEISPLESRIEKRHISKLSGESPIRASKSGVGGDHSLQLPRIRSVNGQAATDKKVNPVLESPEKGLRLVIPSMEKVGQLRHAPRRSKRESPTRWRSRTAAGRSSPETG